MDTSCHRLLSTSRRSQGSAAEEEEEEEEEELALVLAQRVQRPERAPCSRGDVPAGTTCRLLLPTIHRPG